MATNYKTEKRFKEYSLDIELDFSGGYTSPNMLMAIIGRDKEVNQVLRDEFKLERMLKNVYAITRMRLFSGF